MDILPETSLHNLMRERASTLGTAESCTGGLIASRITDVPGSSAYFLGGIVAYAYQLKVDLLDVSWETLNQHGAVSRETVRRRLQVDIAISVSGIAGPGGGTPEKPVGTVWLGLVTQQGEWTRVFHFTGTREQNKASATTEALNFVLDYLQGGLSG
jgi:PncC family amidohydrolase